MKISSLDLHSVLSICGRIGSGCLRWRFGFFYRAVDSSDRGTDVCVYVQVTGLLLSSIRNSTLRSVVCRARPLPFLVKHGGAITRHRPLLSSDVLSLCSNSHR